MSNEFNRYAFWKNPENSNQSQDIIRICKPEYYLDLHGITTLIVSTLKKYLNSEDSIYELGCGTGRNLVGLWEAGFKNVSGVEINKNAVILGKKTFPNLKNIDIKIGTVEDTIKNISQFDCIFTQGLLQHIPPEFDWIHKEIVEKAKKIIMVIENEKPQGIRSWQRNYNDIFTSFGLTELEAFSNTKLKGHSQNTFVRVFKI